MDNQKYQVMASSSSWIESEAVEQLNKVSQLPGMVRCWGMPDLHPGKGIPIGCVAMSREIIYPHLVGNDIGCGMALYQTELKSLKFKVDRMVKKLSGLESTWQGDMGQWLVCQGFPEEFADLALGTIGGGNHFAELQVIDKIHDEKRCVAREFDSKCLVLLIHSGSRGLGETILQAHVKQYGTEGIAVSSERTEMYLKKHDRALSWAQANRRLIASRFSQQLNTDLKPILDLSHNSVTRVTHAGEEYWLHRKGAAPSDCGLVIVPGSRGTLSYLVEPVGELADFGWSLAHGPGGSGIAGLLGHDSRIGVLDSH